MSRPSQTPATATLMDSLLRRDRAIVLVGIAVVTALAWIYLLRDLAHAPDSMHGMAEMPAHALSSSAAAAGWTVEYAALMFTMWWIMMIAMMLPSAAPTILLAAAVNRRSDPARQPFAASGFFVAGYLLIWAVFSAVAVLAQWLLAAGANLSSAMQLVRPLTAGAVLMGAGVWQLTPVKNACLHRCRSPIQLLTSRPRSGITGALATGVEHGTYCVSCCAFLMALLFVGGVMNLYWVAGVALYVLAEKLFPFGPRLARPSGAVLILLGASVLLRGW